MGTVEARLANLGFPVRNGEECWEDKDTGYLYLYSPSMKTVYMVDPDNKRFCHKGIGEGCFYTEWGEM